MTHTTQSKIDVISDFAIELINNWNPDVAFVIGDVAFQNVGVKYLQKSITNQTLKQTPFIFCGVSQNLTNTTEYDQFLSKNGEGYISGISLQEPYQNKIDLSLILYPNATKISFVFDFSLSSKYEIETLRYLIKQNQLNSSNLPIELFQCQTFTDFQSTMTNLANSTSSIIVVDAQFFFNSTNGMKTVEPHIISDWVLSNVPLYVVGPINQGFSMNVNIFFLIDSLFIIHFSR